MRTAQLVRERMADAPDRSFFTVADLAWPCRAVECELSRIAGRGEIVRVRKGLYWKGPMTRVGMPLPRPLDVGLTVAGAGAGPAGLSAVCSLGLTTQVPATETVAVAGRVPAPVSGVRFVCRSIERRINGLCPSEVAVIEVLRDGPQFVEAPWAEVGDAIDELGSREMIRPQIIALELLAEHHPAARQRWAELTGTPNQ